MAKFNILKITSTFIFVFMVFSYSAFSAVYTWDGGGDGTSWDDGTNWAGDAVPGTSDQAIFPSGFTSLTVNGTQTNNVTGIQVYNNANGCRTSLHKHQNFIYFSTFE